MVVTSASDIPFSVLALNAYLQDAISGLEGTPDISPIGGGQSNPTFLLHYPSRKLVLRKRPSGNLLPSAHAIDREFRVLRALAETPAPVPRAMLYCDDCTLIGTPFYIMEFVDGQVFHDCRLPGIASQQRREMYAAMARAMANVHNVDIEEVGLLSFGKPGNYFQRQIARWSRQWSLSHTRDDANIELLITELPALTPEDDLLTIVHGDFRIGNLMFSRDGSTVVSILDWELSTLGHPLADLAHCAIAWLTAPDEYGGLRGLDLVSLGIPKLDAFTQKYASASKHLLTLTPFHLAFALFRWSVIFEGIAARALAGNASSEDAADTGRLSAVFAKQAALLL